MTSEEKEKLNLWEDVNIKVYTSRPGEEHRIIYTIRKKFNNINNILFAEVNKLIEPQETILLSSYNNDDAYIISYSGLELAEMILPIEDKDAVYALKTANSKQFGISFTLSNKLKAYEYLDKYRKTNVFKCAIIESIIHDMRMQDIKIYDTEYNCLIYENSDEEKQDPDTFKDWKDVNYIIWLHRFLPCNFKIRKQFNTVSAIREAENHNNIEPCESIMLYTNDAAYIISYDFSCIIDIIYVIYDQEVLEALERDNTKSPIVFDLCSVDCCKANKYMAKPDVAATMKDILYNIIPDTVTVHELEYNRFSCESELKMGLWKDVNISVELNINNKGECKKLVITKAFLNPEDLMRAQFKPYVDDDDFVLVLGDPDKAYIQCMVEGSEAIYIIAKEGLHREIYETDFDRYSLLYTFDIVGSTDIENPTDFVFDTPEMSEMIMVKYTLYITRYISTNKLDKVIASCLTEESKNKPIIGPRVQPKSEYSIKDIESVKFDPPYTFVVWKDNTVAFHKVTTDGFFSKRNGLAMCIAQKALGDDFEDVFKKFINEDPEED